MKTVIIAALVAAIGSTAFAGGSGKQPPGQRDNNWGETTRDAILDDGFDQGAHASDPSGDGRGKEDRVGLPNVDGRGDLSATMDALGF